MKNFGKVLIVLVSVMLLGGCGVKVEYNAKINNDNSMEFSVLAAYDNEMIDAMMSNDSSINDNTGLDSSYGVTDSSQTPSYTDEDRWNFLEEAFSSGEMPITDSESAERYEDGEYKGYKATIKVDDIDDVTGDKATFNLSDSSTIANSVIFVKKNGNYEANIGIDNSTGSTYSQYTSYGMNFDFKFVVKLPTKAGDNNATSVSEDGKTLTWDLANFTGDSIQFVYKPSNMMIYIIIGAIVLVVIALILVFILGKKKNKKDPREGTPVLVNDNAEVTPVTPTVVPVNTSVNTPVADSTQTTSVFDNSNDNQVESLFGDSTDNSQETNTVNVSESTQTAVNTDKPENLFDSNNPNI